MAADPVDPARFLVLFDALVDPAFRAHPLKQNFASAGRATHAALVIGGRVVLPSFTSDSAGHAEQHLLASPRWAEALRSSESVAVLLNRSPCHGDGCTKKLGAALREAVELPGRFTLAMTSIYETHGPLWSRSEHGATQDPGPTTNFDLLSLASAGWCLRALVVGSQPTPTGKILADYLAKLALRFDPRHPDAVRAS